MNEPIEVHCRKEPRKHKRTCRVDAHLFEEGGVHAEVFGHHVQTEEVSVDAVARHGQAIEVLMLFGGPPEQLSAVRLLLSQPSGNILI